MVLVESESFKESSPVGGLAQLGGQGQKQGLASGPDSTVPRYPVIRGCATTLEEGAPWYPGTRVCAATLEEDRCQFHIT